MALSCLLASNKHWKYMSVTLQRRRRVVVVVLVVVVIVRPPLWPRDLGISTWIILPNFVFLKEHN